ncbi:DUF1015 domain-containing protein [Actinocorallia sp. A-T 12471]|uniref:DUF1015 domain-containing protein n=1 Tax=Actinocorallia sp. A-T 12471 TaxID=3089813 RepID=UPI0029CF15B2|nr:DUF1015 domain-containing protein [Actinocorallia sp. A-T 12471]MDX6744899.1 DUF1015 domain-containing protein [Actinocorallia sp. A-T 12471]
MDGFDLHQGLVLAPIHGVRYTPPEGGSLAAVTCPPYDLIDEDDLARLRAADSHNIVRITLPDGDYAGANRLLRQWLSSGILAVDPSPAVYVYERDGEGGLQRGLIGAVGLRDESEGVILPHEDVYPGPVNDRLALIEATHAHLEPIFLTYEGGGPASEVVDETADTRAPVLEIVSPAGTRYRLWRLEETTRVAADLRHRRALIADGHHRYAAYRAYQARQEGHGPWDFGLALLVDSLRYPPKLGAIHRVLPGLDPLQAAEAARAAFTVRDLGTDAERAFAELDRASDGFLLAGGGGFWLLTDPDPVRLEAALPPGRSARWKALNTAVLDGLLIGDLWKIDPDEHTVQVVHDDAAHAVARAERTGGVAVILKPLTVPAVMALAAGGERVPRKSTSFGPKPRTGLVMRLLDPRDDAFTL